MGLPLPAPTTVNVSDAAKIGLCGKWDKLAFDPNGSRVYRLLEQLAYAATDYSDWTEVDADGKVNLSGGVWSLDSSNSWTTHGLYKTVGIALAEGILQFEIKSKATNGIYSLVGLHSSGALSGTPTGSVRDGISSNCENVNYGGGVSSYWPITADTYYTVRFYIKRNTVENLNTILITFQGGAEYASETLVASLTAASGSSLPDPFYPIINRYVSSAGNLFYVRNVLWKSGLPTDGPTVERIYDAGAGGVFKNLDFTDVVQFGSLVSTNLKYLHSFDDGVADYSAALTLAQLNAVGKITANHRYIRIKTQINSDGAIQAYDAGLYAASVIDAAGPLSSGGGGGSNFNGGMN